jgi:lipoate-protein ligase A
MAVDEVLLASAAAGGAPTLRLYRWRGPWLSLGYAQTLSTERRAACRAAGVGVVRRATGGRAVLHGADLTYAVAAPARCLPSGLEASYRVLSEALLDALRAVGAEAERAVPAPAAGPHGAPFDCFAEAAAEELVAGGRKLVGSAQRRVGGPGGALLQHGSIRLAPDPPAAARASGLGRGATSLVELGLGASAWRRLAVALPRALALRLGTELVHAPLGADERRAVRRRAAASRREPLARRAPDAALASRAP